MYVLPILLFSHNKTILRLVQKAKYRTGEYHGINVKGGGSLISFVFCIFYHQDLTVTTTYMEEQRS